MCLLSSSEAECIGPLFCTHPPTAASMAPHCRAKNRPSVPFFESSLCPGPVDHHRAGETHPSMVGRHQAAFTTGDVLGHEGVSSGLGLCYGSCSPCQAPPGWIYPPGVTTGGLVPSGSQTVALISTPGRSHQLPGYGDSYGAAGSLNRVPYSLIALWL